MLDLAFVLIYVGLLAVQVYAVKRMAASIKSDNPVYGPRTIYRTIR